MKFPMTCQEFKNKIFGGAVEPQTKPAQKRETLHKSYLIYQFLVDFDKTSVVVKVSYTSIIKYEVVFKISPRS